MRTILERGTSAHRQVAVYEESIPSWLERPSDRFRAVEFSSQCMSHLIEIWT